MEITEEAKNKILLMRKLLKENAPLVYQKFAASKISKEPEKKVISTEQVKVEDDFIKGLEEDKEKLENVIPF